MSQLSRCMLPSAGGGCSLAFDAVIFQRHLYAWYLQFNQKCSRWIDSSTCKRKNMHFWFWGWTVPLIVVNYAYIWLADTSFKFQSGSFMHTTSTINKLAGTFHFQIKPAVLGKLLTLLLELLHKRNPQCLCFKFIESVLMTGEKQSWSSAGGESCLGRPQCFLGFPEARPRTWLLTTQLAKVHQKICPGLRSGCQQRHAEREAND